MVVEFLPLFYIHVIIQSICTCMYISHNIFVMILKSLKIKISLLLVMWAFIGSPDLQGDISLVIGYASFYWFTWPTGWWTAMDLYLLSPCQTASMLSIHCSIFSFLWFRILWIIFGPFYLTWPKGSHEILSSLCVCHHSHL